MVSLPALTDAEPRAAGAKTTEDRFGLVGQVLVGKFRVDRPIAEGGFGIVYSAWHQDLNVQVALKIMRVPEELGGTSRDSFVQSFVSEARVIARIKHPNIVSVLDLGVAEVAGHGQLPWMALEWLEGKTLSKVLKERRGAPMHPREALALIRPIFDALAHAHDEGIAHRDIKPANVMLRTTRRGLTPTLLDFGIAKVMGGAEMSSDGETQSTGVFQAFSPQYGSPEQISHSRTGPWTDVHALGLMMSQLLTGRRPYAATDVTEIFREALSDPRPTPAKFGFSVGAWDVVLAKSVAFRPTDRYANAGEFLRALEETVDAAAPIDASIAAPTADASSRISLPTESRPSSVGASTVSSAVISTRAPGDQRSARVAALSIAGVIAVCIVGGLALALHRPPTQPASMRGTTIRPATSRAPETAASSQAVAPLPPAIVQVPAPVAVPVPVEPAPSVVTSTQSAPLVDATNPTADHRHHHRVLPVDGTSAGGTTSAPSSPAAPVQDPPPSGGTPARPTPRIVD